MKSSKIAALVLAASVAGCGGVASQKFNPQAESIKTIALITVPNPVQYQTVDWGGKASFFGALGGAATQADAKTMSLALTQAVKESRFEYSRAMQASLAEQLRRAGFNVVSVTAQRDAPASLLADYRNVPAAGADALLDVDARVVGYSSYNVSDPDLRPHVQADVRLVSARTHATLYSEQFLFGYHNPYMQATHLPSDKQYYFRDFQSLMNNKARAIEGLQRGTEAIAAQIAQRLAGR